MQNRGNEYLCGRADQIVAYIYGEIEGIPRTEFENHLRNCIDCTDEFAMISDARFSVFEWHKEVFVELPTPQFSIPSVAESRPSLGFVSTFVAALGGSGWWAVPAAATLLLSIMFASYYMSRSDTTGEVGYFESTKAKIVALNDRSDISTKDPVGSSVDGGVSNAEPLLRNAANSKPQSIAVRRSRAALLKTKLVKYAKDASPRAVQVVPNRYADIEDKSLRLSDLLDESGG
jgi:hypothetical protein